MKPAELRALAERELTVDLPTAGRAWGIGRTLAFELYQRGEFPVRVHRVGSKLRVSTADLLESLGLTSATPNSSEPAPSAGAGIASSTVPNDLETTQSHDVTRRTDQPGHRRPRPISSG